MARQILFASILLLSSLAHAATPAFTNLTQDDVDKVVKDLASNTTMHSVLPASSLGSIFGFELGVVDGLTRSPNLDEEAKRVDSTTNVSSIPHGGLVGAVTLPISLTIEGTYVPKVSAGDVQYQQWALGLKWTPTDGTVIPVNIALRGFASKSELSFKQTQNVPVIGSQTMTISNTTSVTGLQILASPKLIPILEPYIGVGILNGKGSISQDGSALFNIYADGSASKESSPSSTQLLVGLDVRLLILGAGLEYSKAFGTDSFTGKLSFKF